MFFLNASLPNEEAGWLSKAADKALTQKQARVSPISYNLREAFHLRLYNKPLIPYNFKADEASNFVVGHLYIY